MINVEPEAITAILDRLEHTTRQLALYSRPEDAATNDLVRENLEGLPTLRAAVSRMDNDQNSGPRSGRT